jgi:hypothetical protein
VAAQAAADMASRLPNIREGAGASGWPYYWPYGCWPYSSWPYYDPYYYRPYRYYRYYYYPVYYRCHYYVRFRCR